MTIAADVDGAEIEGHAPRRRRVVDGHEIVEDEVEPEGQRQRRQHRLVDDAVDGDELRQVAEDVEQQRHRRQREQRVNAVAVPGEIGEVAAEHDQRAVQHVDDVQHAPHQREADREARIKRAQHDPIHQRLQVPHRAPSPLAGASPCRPPEVVQAKRSPRTEAPAGQYGSSRHLIIVMSPFLMSAGASTLMCLSCTWMIGRSRGAFMPLALNLIGP